MNKFVIFTIGLSAGFALGTIFGKKCCSEKIRKDFQKMREEYRSTLSKHYDESLPLIFDQDKAKTESKNESADIPPAPERPSTQSTKPFVISPNDFGANQNYQVISYTLYSDGVLADEDDLEISADDVEKYIGRDSLKHFGEYEEDVVYIQNDDTECYYEVCYDGRTYTEVVGENPTLLRNYEEEARRYGGTT